jgi:hypothetical protein
LSDADGSGREDAEEDAEAEPGGARDDAAEEGVPVPAVAAAAAAAAATMAWRRRRCAATSLWRERAMARSARSAEMVLSGSLVASERTGTVPDEPPSDPL